MAVYGGPDIVTDGLIFNMDFANPKCYSGSGSTCIDLSINGFVGETINNPPYNTTINNRFFSFNGATNSRLIRIPNSTALDTQTPSVEVWIRTNSTNQNGFWFEKGLVNSQYSLFQEGTNIQWRHIISGVGLTNLTTSTVSAGLNTTGWFQITGTYSSGQRRLYVNGVLRNSDNRIGAIINHNGGMSIGVYGGYDGSRGYYYNGDIAIVKVYNIELSATQIAQNYNALKGRFGL